MKKEITLDEVVEKWVLYIEHFEESEITIQTLRDTGCSYACIYRLLDMAITTNQPIPAALEIE